jgi:hypothetical protein
MLDLVTELFIFLPCLLRLVAAHKHGFKKLIVLGLLMLALDDSIKECGVESVTVSQGLFEVFVFRAFCAQFTHIISSILKPCDVVL